MSYGLLAAGRADLAIDAGLELYDYAAFRPLIEGAGGVITDWQGRPRSRWQAARRCLRRETRRATARRWRRSPGPPPDPQPGLSRCALAHRSAGDFGC
jgi:fructose-1,6-bisphosphatase/inositol monophosphatase family enzyme